MNLRTASSLQLLDLDLQPPETITHSTLVPGNAIERTLSHRRPVLIVVLGHSANLYCIHF
jgi:hypothetical protein